MLHKLPLFLFFFIITCKHSVAGSDELTSKMAAIFIENKGQIVYTDGSACPEILYKINGNGFDAYLKKNGMSFVLCNTNKNTQDVISILKNADVVSEEDINMHRVDVDFIGANADVFINPSQQQEGYDNFYLGSNAITHVLSYKNVYYSNLYIKVDVSFKGINTNNLKYDIIVQPGGDYKQIKLKYSGAENMYLENGKLIIKTSLGEIVESMPKVFQEIQGKVVDISASYQLVDNCISFEIGKYNSAYALVIDPWATYFGGSKIDDALAVTADAAGNVIFCGYNQSVNFPVSAGAFQIARGSVVNDAFVAKLNSDGQRLWATYFGGNGGEHARALVTNPNTNDIYVTGGSSSTNFFTTAGAFKSTLIGNNSDAFIAKFTSAGTIVWSTLYGNTVNSAFHSDFANGIDLDASGDVFIAGSTAGNLPVVAGAFQLNLSGANTLDGFLAKFTSAGAHAWSTYIGGSSNEEACDVVVDGLNNIIVSGYTESNNFPVSGGAQMVYAGQVDAFVIKFNSLGARVWCTYLGGSAREGANIGFGVDVDSFNNIVVGGETASINFPVTAGAYQVTHAGLGVNSWGDGFVTKYNAAGQVLWSTFLGGSSSELLSGVAINSANHIFVKGQTQSTNFPTTTCSNSSAFIGGTDIFITQFDPSGNLVCSGLTGGTSFESGWYSNQIAISGTDVYTVGATHSADFPVTAGAFQVTNGGLGDAFVMKTCEGNCGLNTILPLFTAASTQLCAGYGTSFTNNSTQKGNCKLSTTTWQWSFPGGNPSTSTDENPQLIVYNTPGNYPVKLIVHTGCGSDSLTTNNYITVLNAPTASVLGNTSICNGGSATLTASGGTSYLWSNASSTAVISVSPTTTTTYSIIASAANSSCTDTAYATVSVLPSPILISTVDTSVCIGSSITLTASGATGYQWFPASGLSSTTGASVNTTLSATTSYSVVGTNSSGCTSYAVININVNQLPIVNVSPSPITICTGSSVTLTATGAINYLWLPVPTIGNTTTVTPTSATTYTVIGSDNNGCTNTSIARVNLASPLAIITPTVNAICEGGNANLTINPSGGTGAYTFNWQPGNFNTPSISVSPTITTTYTVVLTDNCSTPSEALITVSVNALPDVNFSSNIQQGCPELCINFSNTTPTPANQQQWNFGDGNISSANNPVYCYKISGNYSITLMITDQNGCSDIHTKSNYITVYPTPLADFSFSPQATTIIDPTIYFKDKSIGATTWSWSFGDVLNGSSVIQNPTYTYGDTGNYEVFLIVNNDFGCSDTAINYVKIDTDYTLYIPNTFTPNNDGLNDYFMPSVSGINYSDFEFYIFDRWGMQIFKSTQLSQPGWDGRANGGTEIAQQDVYVWMLFVTDMFGKKHQYTGHVNLIR